jgi:hypothetical protein
MYRFSIAVLSGSVLFVIRDLTSTNEHIGNERLMRWKQCYLFRLANVNSHISWYFLIQVNDKTVVKFITGSRDKRRALENKNYDDLSSTSDLPTMLHQWFLSPIQAAPIPKDIETMLTLTPPYMMQWSLPSRTNPCLHYTTLPSKADRFANRHSFNLKF